MRRGGALDGELQGVAGGWVKFVAENRGAEEGREGDGLGRDRERERERLITERKKVQRRERERERQVTRGKRQKRK